MIDFSKILGSVAGAAGSALLGPVGALAGPVVGAIGNGIFNAAAVERERAWSEKMYNKYNSPAALVRQYQEAGINPALMFGQSAIPAPTTSTAAHAPDNPFGDIVGSLGALMQLEMLDEQKRGLALDNSSKEFELGLRKKYGDSLTANDVQKGLVEVRKLKSEASLNEYERKFIKPIERTLMQNQGRALSLDNFEKDVARNFYYVYGYYPNWNTIQKGLGVMDMIFNRQGVNSAAGLSIPRE